MMDSDSGAKSDTSSKSIDEMTVEEFSDALDRSLDSLQAARNKILGPRQAHEELEPEQLAELVQSIGQTLPHSGSPPQRHNIFFLRRMRKVDFQEGLSIIDSIQEQAQAEGGPSEAEAALIAQLRELLQKAAGLQTLSRHLGALSRDLRRATQDFSGNFDVPVGALALHVRPVALTSASPERRLSALDVFGTGLRTKKRPKGGRTLGRR